MGLEMYTHDGVMVDLGSFGPNDVSLNHIARTLGMMPRWSGVLRRFYSVAEHSLNVALATPVEFRLLGLLHDAAEAYVMDVRTPLKRALWVERAATAPLEKYATFEGRILSAILERFEVKESAEAWDVVERVDRKYLDIEFMSLVPRGEGIPVVEPARALIGHSPREATDRFLGAFHEFTCGRFLTVGEGSDGG